MDASGNRGRCRERRGGVVCLRRSKRSIRPDSDITMAKEKTGVNLKSMFTLDNIL